MKERLLKLPIVTWGVGDALYKKLNDCKYNLFILTKTEGIASNLDFFRKSAYYLDDYVVDKDHHVIVIKLKKKHHRAFDRFLESRYSKMFNPREVKEMFEQFVGGNVNPAYYILARDARYEKDFVNILKREFNLDTEIDVTDREWDFPINLKEEILNYA